MSTQNKLLDSEGLEHLIALIKGADAGLRSELMQEIQDAVSGVGGVSADEVTITDNEGVFSVKDGGIGTDKIADGAVTADKLADGAITSDKLSFDPTDGITAGSIGAAEAEHVHDASDVTTGTLPVARGGTGVTTDDALFQKVVTSHYVQDKEELMTYLGLG